jgi:hypothetical protein
LTCGRLGFTPVVAVGTGWEEKVQLILYREGTQRRQAANNCLPSADDHAQYIVGSRRLHKDSDGDHSVLLPFVEKRQKPVLCLSRSLPLGNAEFVALPPLRGEFPLDVRGSCAL